MRKWANLSEDEISESSHRTDMERIPILGKMKEKDKRKKKDKIPYEYERTSFTNNKEDNSFLLPTYNSMGKGGSIKREINDIDNNCNYGNNYHIGQSNLQEESNSEEGRDDIICTDSAHNLLHFKNYQHLNEEQNLLSISPSHNVSYMTLDALKKVPFSGQIQLKKSDSEVINARIDEHYQSNPIDICDQETEKKTVFSSQQSSKSNSRRSSHLPRQFSEKIREIENIELDSNHIQLLSSTQMEAGINSTNNNNQNMNYAISSPKNTWLKENKGRNYEESYQQQGLELDTEKENNNQEPKRFLSQSFLISFISSILAIFVATMITIIDNVPYGLLIFPANMGLNHIGIEIVLIAAILAQISYTLFSTIDGGLGCMIVENVPFLQALTSGIYQDVLYHYNIAGNSFSMTSLKGKNLTQEEYEEQISTCILSTIIAALSISSTLTGLIFYLLGKFNLGKISSYFPKQVLLGCIGGMGVFISAAAFQVSGYPDWDKGKNFITDPRIIITILLEVCLWLLLHMKFFNRSSFITPIFLLLVPLIFYFILFISGHSLKDGQDAGYLFPDDFLTGQSSSSSSEGITNKQAGFHYIQNMKFHSVWSLYSTLSFWKIDWLAIANQKFTFLGIIFFSVLHVPVNVPAICISSNMGMCNLDHELKIHGLSNLLSGLLIPGGLQNYMTYSTSIMYKRIGGKGKWSGIIIAILVSLLVIPSSPLSVSLLLSVFPRNLAGLLLLHLGVALIQESMVDTWYLSKNGVYFIEYVVIVAIVLSMSLLGFIQGLGIGLILCTSTFCMQYSLSSPIVAAYKCSGIRSKKLRPIRERILLDNLQDLVYIIRLSGGLFFGNSEQIYLQIREVMKSEMAFSIEYIIIDGTNVTTIDSHTVDTLDRVKEMLHYYSKYHRKSIELLWVGLHDNIRTKLKLKDAPTTTFETLVPHEHEHLAQKCSCHNLKTLNEAIQMLENLRLAQYESEFLQSKDKQNQHIDSYVMQDSESSIGKESKKGVEGDFLHTTLQNMIEKYIVHPNNIIMKHDKNSNTNNLISCNEITEAKLYTHKVLERLKVYFERQEIIRGTILWRRNDKSNWACILEKGLLGAEIASMSGRGGNKMVIEEYSKPGDFSGELTFLVNEARSCTLRALEDSVVWSIDETKLQKMYTKDHDLVILLLQITLTYASHRLHTFTHIGRLHSV